MPSEYNKDHFLLSQFAHFMGGACSTYVEDDMFLQGFVEETEGKSPL